MGAQAVIDPVVNRFRERLTGFIQVTALIWFGSRSAGRGDEWSDYDFIIVSPDFQGTPFLDRASCLYPLKERGVSYDLLCYTPEEFQEMVEGVTIVREAGRTGIRLI